MDDHIINTENLIWAIKNGDFKAVQTVFLNSQFDVNDQLGERFPLHYAADFGQLKLLEFFIKIGADVDRKDKYGITPILAALWEGHTDCVKCLLQQGANRHGQTPNGQSYAEAADNEEIKSLLESP
ncbi:uncharacterized protein Dwil_GK25099 [Drosophila willistoni]|uniref:Uncharacterized protein n=1 Tax=Drosophila willistoni TaxID=7260 RepID=B4NCE1_DROWI|nr:myotrophin [Drosophila willistoni]EDW82500.1 uncharacterized protein Dwil_GK25099 [Drosophila willistoni]